MEDFINWVKLDLTRKEYKILTEYTRPTDEGFKGYKRFIALKKLPITNWKFEKTLEKLNVLAEIYEFETILLE